MNSPISRRSFVRHAGTLACGVSVAGLSLPKALAANPVSDRSSLRILSSSDPAFTSILAQRFATIADSITSSVLFPFAVILVNDGPHTMTAVGARWILSTPDELQVRYAGEFMKRSSENAIRRPFSGSSSLLAPRQYLLLTPVSSHTPEAKSAHIQRAELRAQASPRLRKLISAPKDTLVVCELTGFIARDGIWGRNSCRLVRRTSYLVQGEYSQALVMDRMLKANCSVRSMARRLGRDEIRFSAKGTDYGRARAKYARKLRHYLDLRGVPALSVLVASVLTSGGIQLVPLTKKIA